MIYIQTALKCEAEIIIKKFGLKKLENERTFGMFGSDELLLLISGIGNLNAVSAVSYAMGKFNPRIAINTGICGTLNPEYNLSQMLLINKITDSLSGKEYFPDMIIKTDIKEASIITSNSVVRESETEKTDCVYDMEAAGFFYGALKFLPPHKIHILKIVSDRLDGRHIKASEVTRMFEDNIDELEKYLLKVKKLNANGSIEKDIKVKTDRLAYALKLTETQRHMLYSYSVYYYTAHGNVNMLDRYKNIKVNDKNERNKILGDIRNELRYK
jgi:adenosylhomocysteine nucleosidase